MHILYIAYKKCRRITSMLDVVFKHAEVEVPFLFIEY